MRRGIRAAAARGLRADRRRLRRVARARARSTAPTRGRGRPLLKGLPQAVKTAATWVPWTYERLAAEPATAPASSRPAGTSTSGRAPSRSRSRGWPRSRACSAHEDLDASSAHVSRPRAWPRRSRRCAGARCRPRRSSTRRSAPCLGVGADLPLRLVRDQLIVGRVMGEVPDGRAVAPLAADLEREHAAPAPEAASAGQKRSTSTCAPRPTSRAATCSTGCGLLGVPWGAPRAASRQEGTFHELWTLAWQPELAVDLVAASRWGTRSTRPRRPRRRGAPTADRPARAHRADRGGAAGRPPRGGRRASSRGSATSPPSARRARADGRAAAARPRAALRQRARHRRDRGGAAVVDGLVARICVGLARRLRLARRRRGGRDSPRSSTASTARSRCSTTPTTREPGAGRSRACSTGRPARPRRRPGAPAAARRGRAVERRGDAAHAAGALARCAIRRRRPRGSRGSSATAARSCCTTRTCSPPSTAGCSGSGRGVRRRCCRCCGARSPHSARPSADDRGARRADRRRRRPARRRPGCGRLDAARGAPVLPIRADARPRSESTRERNDERLRRWRLVLGAEAADGTGLRVADGDDLRRTGRSRAVRRRAQRRAGRVVPRRGALAGRHPDLLPDVGRVGDAAGRARAPGPAPDAARAGAAGAWSPTSRSRPS